MLKSVISIRNQLSNLQNVSFLFCDIQEHFRKHTYKGECVFEAAENMAEFSKILKIPQYITEQKKEVFGETINEIKKHSFDKTVISQKTRFSMFDIEYVNNNFSKDELFILLGVEAQICITHTTLTLLESNRKVALITDAISSRYSGERSIALNNLKSCGAYLTTSEALMFLFMQDSSNKYFKNLLPIIKRKRNTDLLNESYNFL